MWRISAEWSRLTAPIHDEHHHELRLLLLRLLLLLLLFHELHELSLLLFHHLCHDHEGRAATVLLSLHRKVVSHGLDGCC